MSTYSSSKKGNTHKANYDQFLMGEVVNSAAEAKQIAQDYAAHKRYPHRMKLLTVGDANVKPYYPVYLDGLPNGLSGYWTVLSVNHIFGGTAARYLLEIEVGADVLGETDPNAGKNAKVRDVEGEIAGKTSGFTEPPILIEIKLSPNSSDLVPTYGATSSGPATVAPATAVPEGITGNMYSVNPPDFSQISRTVSWVSTPNKGVTNV